MGSAENDPELILEQRTLVQPSAAVSCSPDHGSVGAHHLYLSSLDLYWRDAPYSRRLLFYNTQRTALLQEEMIDRLCSSLAQLLHPFFPAAGRLVTGPSGRPSILCHGQGVEFIVARVHTSLAWLHATHFQPCSFFDLLAPAYRSTTDDPLLPLLSFQITKFSCGGLAIGFSYNNVLADGHSIWHFMNSWAECAREETISVPPYHNREALKVEAPSHEAASQFIHPSCNMSNHEEAACPPLPLVQKLLHFTPNMIHKMKLQAYDNQGEFTGTTFSDYDVVCAHMWRSIIASEAHPKLDNGLTNLGVLGDMRFRMKPQLPRGYFGNATIFAFASVLVRDVRCGALGALAKKVHEACKACNEGRMWAMVNWLELHENKFKEGGLPWRVTCLNVVSSPKFKVYNVDFGWGVPTAARAIHTGNSRDMVLFPGYSDGIDVCLSLSNL